MKITIISKLAGAAVAALFVTGCAAPRDYIAEDDAKCLSYGVPKGSPAYVQCRTQLDQNRAAIRASERFGNSGGLVGAIERATQN